MNLEEEGRSSDSEEGSEKLDAVRKKPEYSYPREFLLSFSNLDICKKLPNGFDKSLLSEFEDAAQSLPDQPSIPGSHPLQGFWRNQYGSSPPSRGDSSNYSRGTYGKWESRSSGRSDRDSDPQSDRDSDSGRRYGHPSRRPWQSSTEQQDGLLGSGSFPRPSGHVSGIYTPKFRANESHQLNKGNEPYHPPRSYKAVPHSRRDKDSYNDETFGSVECDNEDRAEEERRRRASFEMIRKEQQKALQEKQKLNLEKHSSLFPNLSKVLEDKKEEIGPSSGTKELEVSTATAVSSNNLDRSFSSQAPASRPLVPPGFNNGVLEKSSAVKYHGQTPLLEEHKPAFGESHLDPEVSLFRDETSAGLEERSSQEINLGYGQPSESSSPLDTGGNGKSLYDSDVPVRRPGMEDHVVHASSHLDTRESLNGHIIVGLNSDVLEDKTVVDANKKFSTSILEKILFGGPLSINDNGSDSVKYVHSEPDDVWNCKSAQPSKFAQWLSEEETKSTGISFGGPNELLSLMSASDKDQCQVRESEAANIRPGFSLEQSNKLDSTPTAKGVTDKACVDNKEDNISTVMTCEDLEQSFLTEYSAKNISIKPLSEGWNTTDIYTEQTSKHVDDHASLHLLSLLQKGSDENNISLNSDVGHNLDNKPLVFQEPDMNVAVHENKHEENGKSAINLGKTITLETLFGSAFMKELQSVEAPISVQRGSNEDNAPGSLGLLFPAANNIFPSSATDLDGLQGPSRNHGVLASNDWKQIKQTKTDKWLGLDDSGNRTISSNDRLEEVFKLDGFGTVEYQPSEAGLLSHRMLTFMPTHNSVNNVDFSSNVPIDMLGKLTGNAFKDDRAVVSENLPYPNLDPPLPYPGLQVQQPLPQFQPPQMAPLRPFHDNFESHAHMGPQMESLGLEHMATHYSSANRQFPANMIRHPLHPPNFRHTGLDVQSLASMQHQIQLSINQSQIVPDFPRGGPIPNPGNQAAGFIQETNQRQGFLPETCQPNIGCPALPIPGLELNSGQNTPPPELFQRLIEMGVQSKSKHANPLASGYSHGLDMGFHS